MFRSASQPLTQTWALHRLMIPGGRRGDQIVPAGSQRGLLGAKTLDRHPRLWPSQSSGSLPPATRRNHLRVCVQLLTCVQLCVTPRTAARQAPLSMGFSRQEYWSGLPCPPPGDPPNPETEPVPLKSPALASGFFTTSAPWEALHEPYPVACIRMSGGGAGHRRCFRVPDDANKYAGLGNTAARQGKGW